MIRWLLPSEVTRHSVASSTCCCSPAARVHKSSRREILSSQCVYSWIFSEEDHYLIRLILSSDLRSLYSQHLAPLLSTLTAEHSEFHSPSLLLRDFAFLLLWQCAGVYPSRWLCSSHSDIVFVTASATFISYISRGTQRIYSIAAHKSSLDVAFQLETYFAG